MMLSYILKKSDKIEFIAQDIYFTILKSVDILMQFLF